MFCTVLMLQRQYCRHAQMDYNIFFKYQCNCTSHKQYVNGNLPSKHDYRGHLQEKK